MDEEEAKSGLKLQTDIAITTPKYLGKLLQDDDIVASKLRVKIIDEADLALESMEVPTLNMLFDNELLNMDGIGNGGEVEEKRSCMTFLVGASVTEALGTLPVKDKILPPKSTYIATATSFAPLEATTDSDDSSFMIDTGSDSLSTTSLKQLRLNLDPGLLHQRMIAPNDTGLLYLCRLIRNEQKEYALAAEAEAVADMAAKTTEGEEENTNNNTSNLVRPRIVIFFPDEKSAASSLPKLRDALWGQEKLCVLLPNSGVNPLDIMEQFKRNETSVMLATPNSVRGLDFEGLTHVYTLYLPVDAREYVHLAGRVGRIGQVGSISGKGGRVVSILGENEAEKMEHLAEVLGFGFSDIDRDEIDTKVLGSLKGARFVGDDDYDESEVGSDTDDQSQWEGLEVEDMRRYLEDTITLLGNDDEETE